MVNKGALNFTYILCIIHMYIIIQMRYICMYRCMYICLNILCIAILNSTKKKKSKIETLVRQFLSVVW
jgi:hypothetical protein